MLPFTPLLNRLRPSPSATHLRWPVSAGFEPVRTGIAPAWLAAMPLCCLAGSLRYTGQPITACWTASELAYYNLASSEAYDPSAPTVTLTGYVVNYPVLTDTGQELAVTATELRVDGVQQPVQGTAHVTTRSRHRYVYGQALRLTGRMVTPITTRHFLYRDYLLRQGMQSQLMWPQIEELAGPRQGDWLVRWLYAVRAQGEVVLSNALSEPYAALASGMLLGIEAGIPRDLLDQFRATGTSHVIVISGSNVAIVSGVIMATAARVLGRRRALLPALAGIAGYAILVGGEAAVIRASIMGGLFVTAGVLNRRSTALVSLAAACTCMVMRNPLLLWDVGLQMSSLATAGLIVLVPPYTRLLWRMWSAAHSAHRRLCGTTVATPAQNKPDFVPVPVPLKLVAEGLILSSAATVMTMPLILLYFQRLSVVSLLTNLLIVPVQPLIMLGGGLGIMAGSIGPAWLARLVLWLPYLGLAWTVGTVQWTASLPGASQLAFGFTPPVLAAIYALILMCRWPTQVQQVAQHLWAGVPADRWVPLVARVAAGLLGAAVIAAWWAGLSQPDGRLHVWFLDVGQGDGVLIQTPSGRQVLIDGGAKPQLLFGELAAVMPLWDRTLDLVVLTHPDDDHGLAQTEAPTRFAMDTAWATAGGPANPKDASWRTVMHTAGVKVQTQSSGGWADLGDGVALWVLGPPAAGFDGKNAENDNSLVTKLVYGDFSVLLTGDASTAAENHLLASHAPKQATVLKIGHHGSSTSTGQAFLDAVNPTLAVIQVGQDNKYGHPNPDLLGRLTDRLILRTDTIGRIEITSDGRQMWVETQH